MWKYLLICSLGIGTAVFGILLAYAGKISSSPPVSLSFADMAAAGATFHPVWYKLAFVFCLAGFGTKMRGIPQAAGRA